MKDTELLTISMELLGSSPVDPATESKKASFRATLGLGESPQTHLPPFPTVLGHRGACYAALENTIPAFLQCATWGCGGIELDVFRLRDGQVVVFHGSGTDEGPGYLSEYCIGLNEGANIMDLTYKETQELRFNPNFAEFPCGADKITTARVPLLSDVLMALKGTGMEIKIELKTSDVVLPALQVVEELGMTKFCSYSSFDHSRLLELRKLRPCKEEYPTGALFNKPLPRDYLKQAKACGATEVHFPYDTCTVANVQRTRQAGLKSMAWLRGPRGMAQDTKLVYEDLDQEGATCYMALWETGVDKICCNRPDIAMFLCHALNDK